MTRRPLKITLLLVGLLSLPVVGFGMGWRFLEAVNAPKECLSQSRFAQIREMLLQYHEQHGAFPPTKYQPKAGGPVHSWRVLLVPDADTYYSERYSRYDFSQDWNSPNNLQALGNMPHFTYFSKDGNNTETTNYLAIGDGDEWPSKRALKSRLVTKGKDRFLVVEDPDSTIHWMEPKY